ncbi:MarR family winged helix-turn-helix transcriptional regulator [Aquimarina rhabdastrellae]
MGIKLEEALKTTFQGEKYKGLLNVMYTANWVKTLHDDTFQQYHITVSQFNILRILNGASKNGEQLTMNQVKMRMIDKTPNTTRLVKSLLSKAYVKRKQSEDDRRVVYVDITPLGVKLVEEMTVKLENTIATVTTLNQEEYKQLNKLLDKLRPNE